MNRLIKPNEGAIDVAPFFALTPDLVCIAGRDGYFRKINEAVSTVLGYSEEELFAQPIFSFMHPDDRERTGREREKLLMGSPLINYQNRYIRKNGEVVWLDWTAIYFPENELVFAIAKDVTARKHMEQELVLQFERHRSLASHFKTRLEQDIRHLSFELHEQLAQLAAVVKMDLGWIAASKQELPPIVYKQVEHASYAMQLMFETIRRMSLSLSPAMITEIGFLETLKWYCNEFAVLNSVGCSLKGQFDEATLVYDIKLELFRSIQELLKLIRTQAAATNIQLELIDKPKELTVAVVANSTGWHTLDATATTLQFIEQQVEHLHGTITTIQTESATRVELSIPKE